MPQIPNILVHPTIYLSILNYAIKTKFKSSDVLNTDCVSTIKYQDSLSLTILIVSGTSIRDPTTLQKFFNDNVTFIYPKASFG